MRGGLLGFRAGNHPQQIARRGADDSVDDRGTSPEVFDPLNERFGFTLDVAAAPHNAKVPFYFTKADDGLSQSWGGARVWCNPPYSDLASWTAKAWAEWSQTACPCGRIACTENDHLFWPAPNPVDLIVMLVPGNRPEQGWWQDHVEPFRDRVGSPLRTEFFRGRLRFIRHDLGYTEVRPNDRPPFGCCLLIWSR